MEKVIDLKDLLKHEIMDLYSAEEQIIEALPLMIDKAGDEKLKAALQDHLKVTEEQKSRLDEIKRLLSEAPEEGDAVEGQNTGFFSRLFGEGAEKCKGMEGLITEGKKMMSADMSPEACDAAIIAGAQKIEHYEISGYGTARAFARELNLVEVASILEQTLKEEYAADDLLTRLAVGNVNVAAEFAEGSENGSPKSKRVKARSGSRSNGIAANARSKKSVTPLKANAKKLPAKKAAAKGKPSKPASKSPASKRSIPPAKKSTSTARGRNNNTKGKAKIAVKKSAAKQSKGRNSKAIAKKK